MNQVLARSARRRMESKMTVKLRCLKSPHLTKNVLVCKMDYIKIIIPCPEVNLSFSNFVSILQKFKNSASKNP